MKTKSFSIHERVKSFRFAAAGITRFFRKEHNARIHLVISVTVMMAAWIFHVSKMEFIILLFAICIVWAAEIFNTAIEQMMDLLHPHPSLRVKYIKDLSAGAVLVTAIAAAIAGAFIFIPKIF